ncbi:MAG: type II toxin-antitoxin system RelE/ParE family toxin [Rhizobiales bacterium]|nr:type II toxin-antitoxin system RelE/ParE family toxin [Hyphomicrobiales bacterium]
MNSFRLSRRARSDLESIWDYTAEGWGVEQADSYVQQIWEVIGKLAGKPSLGRDASAVRPGLLKYPAQSHMIQFRAAPGVISVVRVLHQKMDLGRHL